MKTPKKSQPKKKPAAETQSQLAKDIAAFAAAAKSNSAFFKHT